MRARRSAAAATAVAATAIIAAVGAHHAAPATCGTERWAVKTLTDTDAGRVTLTPVPTTVAALTRLSAPHAQGPRLAPVETTTYRVTGVLTFATHEADHDYHLVIESRGAHMVAEIPDPSCMGGSRVQPQVARARAAFESRFGTHTVHPNATVTLTGVGFFDKIHGQTGVAPNGIELHPVLEIR